MKLTLLMAGLCVTACAAPAVERTGSATVRYDAAIKRCTQLPDMDMQSCLADLNAKSVAEEKRMLRANMDVNCEAEAKRFEGGTGYWSAIYICSIKQRTKLIDGRIH